MSMHDDIKTVLVSEEELKAKVAQLGAQISKDYEGKNLVLVSILKHAPPGRPEPVARQTAAQHKASV